MLSLRYHYSVHTRFCGYQCVTVPKILNDTDIPILFSCTKYFRYRCRYFIRYQICPIPVPRLFQAPNFSDTGSDTTRKFPLPIINLQNSKKLATKISSGTKFFRYRFRDFFPVPNFSDTGFETFYGTNFFRYHQKNENFPVPVCHTLVDIYRIQIFTIVYIYKLYYTQI